MPVADEEHNGNEHSEQEESSNVCWPVQLPPSVTMSKFLALPTTIEEVEEDIEEDPTAQVLSPEFKAHFLVHPPSVPPPSLCHIPVLCMATEEHLPVVMTSLLYQ
ncbi:hypothetical protein F5J12DRAFT_782346 [Pisolithus orientalis]|uniref:uncharacterized protein n=1 Tax=Pisolithus orientalis TaxID=936130 RepID=UPI0022250F48|nr:uncharacterized protein F5J12DRAFT_782346 [Pisolithus orientalis]KAI6008103.1 hypothetical protein F5J12DRAFT_782346 [Pisolithus orientalis]